MTRPAGSKSGSFGYRCQSCGEWHDDVPALEVSGPVNLLAMPEAERAERCIVETDFRMVDGAGFYVRGLIELAIIGSDHGFVQMVWVSLSQATFVRSVEVLEEPKRSHVGPFFGWLDTTLPLYPETRSLETAVRLRDDVLQPIVVREPTDHPLAVEQRRGIAFARVAEILAACRHRFARACPRRPARPTRLSGERFTVQKSTSPKRRAGFGTEPRPFQPEPVSTARIFRDRVV